MVMIIFNIKLFRKFDTFCFESPLLLLQLEVYVVLPLPMTRRRNMSVNSDVYSDVSDSNKSGLYWYPLETLYQLSAIADRQNQNRHKIIPSTIFFSMPPTEAPE